MLKEWWYHRHMTTATAQAAPNIAFIKYWGNRDNTLRLPSNGSISMNLDSLYTRTTVSFQPSLPYDELVINGHETMGKGLDRISYLLDIICGMAWIPGGTAACHPQATARTRRH